MSRRTKRSRVSASGEMSPRMTAWAMVRPRRDSARSRSTATASATTSEVSADSQRSLDSQNSETLPSCARSMGIEGRARRAVLLDALGTLLRLEPPAPRLRAALRARARVDVGDDAATRAMRAEIRFYRAHLHEGRNAGALADLRRRAADAMRPALPRAAATLPSHVLTAALLDALEFTPFPDVAPALAALRTRGVALVVVSNWDVSLHDRLAETGLRALVDGAVASAELGVAKPDPAIFHHALALVGADAAA